MYGTGELCSVVLFLGCSVKSAVGCFAMTTSMCAGITHPLSSTGCLRGSLYDIAGGFGRCGSRQRTGVCAERAGTARTSERRRAIQDCVSKGVVTRHSDTCTQRTATRGAREKRLLRKRF